MILNVNKVHREVLESSNVTYTISSRQGQILQKHGFPFVNWAVLGFQGIVVKGIAAPSLLG